MRREGYERNELGVRKLLCSAETQNQSLDPDISLASRITVHVLLSGVVVLLPTPPPPPPWRCGDGGEQFLRLPPPPPVTAGVVLGPGKRRRQ